MDWEVRFHDEFENDFDAFSEDVQANLPAAAKAVQIAGPKAGRPHVDTLDGSKHANMKELRFTAHNGREVWRAAFAFDPHRTAVVLVAADKQRENQKLFYKRLIKIADQRFDVHLQKVASGKKPRGEIWDAALILLSHDCPRRAVSASRQRPRGLRAT